MKLRTSSCRSHVRPARGFTLIELMVTIALVAIMLAIAAPSFVSFKRNSELTSIANNFLAALNAARTEAMKRNMFAMVMPANNDNDWSQGWTVFVDANDNGVFDSGDIVVMQQEAPPPYITLTGNGSTAATRSYVRYDGSGFSRPMGSNPASTTLTIARSDASSDPRQIRRVKIAITGRPKVCTPQSSSDSTCSGSD
ncbi:GspH/FimT family pseudopilin [Paracidovorax avenae]|uniref:GspH/FimT family pseudopilin n=1 Tax=Paracidovorax avenae TaxID=80867 RepID=UPI0006B3C03D|nr:GspH/FimT family pseudopilin [Paracidovorax avenae]